MKNIRVIFRDQVRYLDLYIIKGNSPTSLGRQWLKEFGLWPLKLERLRESKLNKVCSIEPGMKSKIFNKFSDLFYNS